MIWDLAGWKTKPDIYVGTTLSSSFDGRNGHAPSLPHPRWVRGGMVMEMGQKRTAEPSFSSPGGGFYPCSGRHQRQKNHPVFNTITVNIIAICAFQLRESLPESILTASILPITFFSPSRPTLAVPQPSHTQ